MSRLEGQMNKFTEDEIDLLMQCLQDCIASLTHVHNENIRAPGECTMNFQTFLNDGVRNLIDKRKDALNDMLHKLSIQDTELANDQS